MKNLAIILILVTANLCASCQNSSEKKYVTADDLNEWVSFLASDEMRGRQNGSPEMVMAAEWLSSRFEEFALKPLYEDNKFIREYTFSRRDITVAERNVVGYIEGSDPDLKNEYIIITAHFDHVGVRAAVEGDSIYNGADDNAAGTATLLGVAKSIHESGKAPGRSIIFAAVSGEEMGLQGSRNLAGNLPVPLLSLYANVNFEMTGHSEELGRGNFYMTGCSYSNLDNVIKDFDIDYPVTLIDTIALANRLFYMSDNLSFARIREEEKVLYGIPGGTFATSTFAGHIHKPVDEVALFDLDNMSLLVNYFSEMVLRLSYSDQPVIWTDPRFKMIE